MADALETIRDLLGLFTGFLFIYVFGAAMFFIVADFATTFH